MAFGERSRMKETALYENHCGLTEPGLPVISREYRLRSGEEEVRLHWHEGVELIYVLEGSCTIQRNLCSQEIFPGDLVIVSAGQLHRISSVKDVRYEYMILERELWEELDLSMAEDQFTENVIQGNDLGQILLEYARLRPMKDPYGQIQRKGLLYLLTGRLLAEYQVQPKKQRPMDKRLASVRSAILYMEENYRRPISMEELGRAAGYSKYHFCRCFKEITGMTVVEYGNRLRCERTKKLLLTGSYTIEEAAFDSGFLNMAHFYRTYKKYMGHLPSADIPARTIEERNQWTL